LRLVPWRRQIRIVGTDELRGSVSAKNRVKRGTEDRIGHDADAPAEQPVLDALN
jgi:hypothetical protein